MVISTGSSKVHFDSIYPTVYPIFPVSALVAVSGLLLSPKALDMGSWVTDLSLSPSSDLLSLTLVSLSSSLSPRLNGSLSVIGEGSTADRGCHLLALPPETGVLNGFVEPGRESGISSAGPDWKATFRPDPGEPDLRRSGFASGL